jgi:hypothetical protein
MRKKNLADVAQSGPTPIRTGGIVPEAGIWEIRCSRETCCRTTEITLRLGAKAPPCVRCLNPASMYFLREAAPVEEGDRRFRFRRGTALLELPAEPTPGRDFIPEPCGEVGGEAVPAVAITEDPAIMKAQPTLLEKLIGKI